MKTATGASLPALRPFLAFPSGPKEKTKKCSSSSCQVSSGRSVSRRGPIAANSADIFRGARSAAAAQGRSWRAVAALTGTGVKSASRAGCGSPQRRYDCWSAMTSSVTMPVLSSLALPGPESSPDPAVDNRPTEGWSRF